MSAVFSIGPIELGPGRPPLFIPEIGANHDGDEDIAAEMVSALASRGARVVKFQMYTSAELVSDHERVVTWGPAHARKQERIGSLFDRLSLSPQAITRLYKHARSVGLIPLCTAFSEEGFDHLHSLNSACLKVASSDVNHTPLLRHLGKLRTPILLSLGKATMGEAADAVDVLLSTGCPQLCLLHCVAEYPAPVNEMNLRIISSLAQSFPNCVVGLSDHSTVDAVAVAAVALGSVVVEKHVTFDVAAVGPDHWFSLPIEQVDRFQRNLIDAYDALGTPSKRVQPCEVSERRTSVRSLVLARAVTAGTLLVRDDIKIVRPGTGLAPRHLDDVLGLSPCRSYPADTPITWDMFKP